MVTSGPEATIAAEQVYAATLARGGGAVIDYRCRACRYWPFASDATHGRVRITCPSQRCRVAQLVFLGRVPSATAPRPRPPLDERANEAPCHAPDGA